jgi:UDPglucose 6-dehydrogenase
MISIISGYGYVGRATELALLHNGISVSLNDPALGLVTDDWERAAYHHVCVPTPSSITGEHDITALEDAIMHARICGFRGITVIRSTIGPLEFDRLGLDPNSLVWPEFLRKATWDRDAVNPLVSIVGGEDCRDYLRDHPKLSAAVVGDARTACMAKLAINSYLAVRTVITHDIRRTCDTLGLNWMGVKQALDSDPRLGKGYWEQPGPDGNFGFGGGCLPKDTLGMATLLEKTGLDDGYASWAIKRNSKLRDH